jgi:hypothetical protein
VKWLDERLEEIVSERQERARQVRETVLRYRQELSSQEALLRPQLFAGRKFRYLHRPEAGEA